MTLGTLTLAVPGRHNLLNALAAVAVGLELGLSFDRVAAGLKDFRGAERRFDVRGEPNGILVVDDYGHHPTEIAAVIAAARTFGRRIVVAFQPHRYSRTASLMEAFGPALGGADHVVLTDIYAAGEDPIPGVTLETLAAAVRRSVAVPVDLVAAPRRRRAGDRPRGEAGRHRDHAGRRIDRDGARSPGRGIEAMSAVAARTDRRFRRAHVKPGRKRAMAAVLQAAGGLDRRPSPALAYGVYRTSVVAAQAHVLLVDHIVVRGNERLSNGEVLAVLNGLRGESLMWTDLDVWRRPADGARRGCATRRCGARCRRRSKSSSSERTADRHRPHRRRDVPRRRVGRDHRSVRPALRRPRSADRRRPADGAGGAGSMTDEARAELAARVIAAVKAKPQIASRLSQVDVSDLHNAAVILSGDQRGDPARRGSVPRPAAVVSRARRRRCASGSPRSTPSTCASTIGFTFGRSGRASGRNRRGSQQSAVAVRKVRRSEVGSRKPEGKPIGAKRTIPGRARRRHLEGDGGRRRDARRRRRSTSSASASPNRAASGAASSSTSRPRSTRSRRRSRKPS